ncbi:hypothetical protein LXM94_11255 [Rhizobium sp. TRM95111]|uniref:hypothetical protein n=1 Tax=Rhizobium alarense TaxID=2846851 RepID=UPI001F2A5204|nr:hypothetical protein [Rhizobium alarense]MCF3640540.1 hypothetical protein [Rhizobium alarense]
MIRPLFFTAALLVAAPTHARDEIPYVGTWDCEVATFVFTADTYDAGEGPMPILRSTEENGTHTLSFKDDYRISLSNVTETGMDWFSEASGDGFHCKKIAD